MMRRFYKNIIVFAVLIVAAVSSFGQVMVKASADRDKILIGEAINLSLQANFPLGEPVTWFPLDTIPHFEFINKGKIDTVESIEGKKLTQQLVITSFDSGRWEIPKLELRVGNKAYFTDTISIEVAFAPFDPAADYRDIKAIEEIVNPNTKYIPWVIAAVTLISLLLMIYLLRKPKRVATEERKPVHKLSPYDEAMQALAVLRKNGFVQNGQVKIYYTQLNDILRTFVLRKLNINTLEKTNEELIIQLKQLNMSGDFFTQLAQSLRMSDFVKFAKYQPGQSDNEKNFKTVEEAIKRLNEAGSQKPEV